MTCTSQYKSLLRARRPVSPVPMYFAQASREDGGVLESSGHSYYVTAFSDYHLEVDRLKPLFGVRPSHPQPVRARMLVPSLPGDSFLTQTSLRECLSQPLLAESLRRLFIFRHLVGASLSYSSVILCDDHARSLTERKGRSQSKIDKVVSSLFSDTSLESTLRAMIGGKSYVDFREELEETLSPLTDTILYRLLLVLGE